VPAGTGTCIAGSALTGRSVSVVPVSATTGTRNGLAGEADAAAAAVGRPVEPGPLTPVISAKVASGKAQCVNVVIREALGIFTAIRA
jgi:hypothetical protein